jgi:cellobiose-specific phosphotransferase system component IIB
MSRAERIPVVSAKAAAPVAAAALKCMRDLFIEAQGLPLSQLAAQLSSADGLLVGMLAVYRMNEVEARLRQTGVRLERIPHEDDDR